MNASQEPLILPCAFAREEVSCTVFRATVKPKEPPKRNSGFFTGEAIAEKRVLQPQEVYNKGVQWKNTSAITLVCVIGSSHHWWVNYLALFTRSGYRTPAASFPPCKQDLTCGFPSNKPMHWTFTNHTSEPRSKTEYRSRSIGRLQFRSRE